MSTRLTPLVDPPKGYSQLTRRELRGFDRGIAQLAQEAIDAGCTGRITRNMHLVLFSDAGQTMTLPSKAEFRNRSGQNTRAELRRFLRQHQSVRQQMLREHRGAPGHHPGQDSIDDCTPMSVKQAFLEGRQDFMRFFDGLEEPLSPDAVVEATGTPGQRCFRIIDRGGALETGDQDAPADEPTAETSETSETGQDHERPELLNPAEDDSLNQEQIEALDDDELLHECPTCHRIYRLAMSLATHQRIHRRLRTNVYSMSNVARFNEIPKEQLVRRLIEASVHEEGQFVDITPEDLEAAGLKVPPMPKRFSTVEPVEQTAAHIIAPPERESEAACDPDDHEKEAAPMAATDDNTAAGPTPLTAAAQHAAAHQPAQSDPEQILQAVRAALGPDPRIAQLEGQVAGLTRQLEEKSMQLNAKSAQLEVKSARLDRIQKALRS